MNIIYLRTKDNLELFKAIKNEDGSYTLEGFRVDNKEGSLKVFTPERLLASEFTDFQEAYTNSNERQYNALKQMYQSWYPETIADRVGV